MSVKRTCQVIMLPTKEKTGIILIGNWKKLHIPITEKCIPSDPDESYQHLYITSDEEIKEMDWCIANSKDGAYKNELVQYRKGACPPPHVSNLNILKKIIATTNKSLLIPCVECLKTGKSKFMPEPSLEFLEKFVEEYNSGKPITEVMVEYRPELYDGTETTALLSGRLKVNKANEISISKVKDSWTREEVTNIASTAFWAGFGNGSLELENAMKIHNNWIEQNL